MGLTAGCKATPRPLARHRLPTNLGGTKRQRPQQHARSSPRGWSVNYFGEAPAAQPVVVAALKAGLSQLIDAAHVGTKFKEGRSVRVSRMGGADTFATDTAGFLFECYDPSEAEAERLAIRVDRIFKEARGRQFAGGYVTAWSRTSGPVNFPDPATNLPRFQLTGDLTLLIQ